MNPKVIPFLHDELHLHKTAETECVRRLLDLCLELGECPENIYEIMEERDLGSRASCQKHMSRVGRKLWERGTGVFHTAECEYESPLETVHDILYYLSDHKIW